MVVDKVDLSFRGDSNGTVETVELKDELEKFYRIKPNKNSRSYNYFKYKDVENPGWIKRWLKNKRSVQPSLVDSVLIEETKTGIVNYLRNKKGYYQAELDYEVINSPPSKRASIKYLVQTGPRYTINTISHLSQDSTLEKKLNVISLKSLLRKGDPIDAFIFDLEKQRIVSEFQKLGYADFNLTNVDIKGDSTELANSWDIFMVVTPPSDNTEHQRFRIGEVNVYTDYHRNQKEENVKTEYRNDKNYKRQSEKFIVRPSTIDRKIYLNKYDRYNSEAYYKTIRSLFSLGTYRLATLTPEVNAQDSSLIDYNILLTPHNRKYIMDFGVEAFYSNISIQNKNLVGIALSGGLENRNAFNGSEVFKTSIETGVEFDPTVPEIVTLSVGWNNKVEIPTLTKPFNVLRPLNKINVINDERMGVLQDEGKSNISLGFSYLDNLDLYKILSIKAGYGYDFFFNKQKRVTFNQIGINYTKYDIPPNGRFQRQVLDQNEVLERSFKTSLFTGFLFKDLTYYYQSDRGKYRANYGLITQLELSGLEVYLANSIANAFTGNNSKWTLQGVEFERLAKIEFDLRWYQRARKRSQLAARLRTGIAIPLDKGNPVSYIKQYSVGGPSSIRAWRTMNLGPGQFFDPAIFPDAPSNTIFYQRGDILLDMSMEYRFDVLWVLEGALFVDAGNIWTLKEDTVRPGAKIGPDFLSTLAVGYGYGIRFDFSYFIIRFDLGFKLKYPSVIDSNGEAKLPSKWTGPNWGKSNSQRFGNFNIAVNYPF